MAIPEDMLENLDCSWPDALREYAEKLKQADLSEEDAIVRDQLIDYSKTKMRAMYRRAAGDIMTALRLERECDSIYDMLPHYAKW